MNISSKFKTAAIIAGVSAIFLVPAVATAHYYQQKNNKPKNITQSQAEQKKAEVKPEIKVEAPAASQEPAAAPAPAPIAKPAPAPVKTKPATETYTKTSPEPTNSGVSAISLMGSGSMVKWLTTGYSAKGFKVTWSKTPGPTYPTRDGDQYHYISDPNAYKDYISAFDGPGVYYVRVCEYLGGSCGVYSNQINLSL